MAVAVHTAEAVHAVGSLLFQKINSRAYIPESVMLGMLTEEMCRFNSRSYWETYMAHAQLQ